MSTQPSFNHPTIPGAVDWTRVFATEHDIWIQNVSTRAMTLEIDVGNGENQHITPPLQPTSDPFCITNFVPFVQLKRSAKFRQLVQKRWDRQPAVLLLSEEQVQDYWVKDATERNLWVTGTDGNPTPDIIRAQQLADERRANALKEEPYGDSADPMPGPDNNYTFAPPRSVQEAHQQQALAVAPGQQVRPVVTFGPDGQQLQKWASVRIEHAVHPRILHLCTQVAPQIPEGQKLSEQRFHEELKSLLPRLQVESLRYLAGNCYWQSVRNVTNRRLEEVEQQHHNQAQPSLGSPSSHGGPQWQHRHDGASTIPHEEAVSGPISMTK